MGAKRCGKRGPMLDVPLDGVCPLQCVFFNKIDSLGPSAKMPVTSWVAMPVSQYVLQWGRKLAILSGSGLWRPPRKVAQSICTRVVILFAVGTEWTEPPEAVGQRGANQPLLDDNEDDNALSAPPTPQQDKVHTALRSADGGEELVVATVSKSTSSHGTGVGVTMPFILEGRPYRT